MNKIIVIDGLIYKLKVSDFKRLETLTSEPDKTDMRGNKIIRNTSDNLYLFLCEITENYKAIGVVRGNFTL